MGPGQEISYTPTISGIYSFGLTCYAYVPGYYTITGGDAWVGLTDTTIGTSAEPFMAPYSGPVGYLGHEFVDLNADNLNITATCPNVFLHSGSGEDALQVSSGNNVMDGGTGSNFLVGGTGNDTFFVDDRSAPADIWSTLVNFHSGDAATVWGVSPADFALNWSNNTGAAGYTGLTLTASAPGKPNASLTLAGYTHDDLNNGRLTVMFGTDPASGSNYMYIHGN
jgi:Ca2+-binding RTX toxin-like protein